MAYCILKEIRAKQYNNHYIDSAIHSFFYKNKVYKNIKAQNC